MATEDIVTLEEAQRLLQLDGRVDGATLAMYITAASRRIDAICGPVVTNAIAGERHDGGTTAIWLKRSPLRLNPSVAEYDSTGTATYLAVETPGVFSGDRFVCDLTTGKVTRRRDRTTVPFEGGLRNIEVAYSAGRYATTADVDGRFKEACMMLVQQLWRREQSSGSVTFGMPDSTWVPSYAVPKAVLELLADEVLPPGVA